MFVIAILAAGLLGAAGGAAVAWLAAGGRHAGLAATADHTRDRLEAAEADLSAARQRAADEVATIRVEAGVEVDRLRAELVAAQADTALTEQVRALSQTQDRLHTETANLVTALRAPSVRGRWGEMQLRRVVEAAGMVRHCDFEEQVTVTGPDGVQRPDLVVRLPGGKHLVVDAKVPLNAYLEAAEAPEADLRTRKLG